ncbi:DNA (cytosine-5)-methyltransferase DRM2 [Hordeum vulgare]|nr:DNA (cytosine-5)-methyltransferase DRM2 [Hordeum vulgare]
MPPPSPRPRRPLALPARAPPAHAACAARSPCTPCASPMPSARLARPYTSCGRCAPPPAQAAASRGSSAPTSGQPPLASPPRPAAEARGIFALLLRRTTIDARAQDALLELLLTYKALGDDDAVGNHSTSGCNPPIVEDDNDLDFENWDGDYDAGGRESSSDDSGGEEDFLREMSEKDEKIKSLRGMGFSEDEANMTILICGMDADISVLVDSITASQVEEACHSRNLSDRQVTAGCFDSFGGIKRNRLTEESKKKRKRYGGGAQGNRPSLDGSDEEPMPLPNPMIGFNLPGWGLSMTRVLPELAIGPPYFYYENVARAPKGVWAKISRFLFDIQPEFVDSLHLCAAARKRGYIHNLPTENRSPILPLPPKTIFEAFPHYKKWWPSWDQRTHLNCLQTCMASAKETERIQQALSSSGNPPPQSVHKYVSHKPHGRHPLLHSHPGHITSNAMYLSVWQEYEIKKAKTNITSAWCQLGLDKERFCVDKSARKEEMGQREEKIRGCLEEIESEE